MSGEERRVDTLDLPGYGVSFSRSGIGQPILFLHSELGLRGSDAFISRLSELGCVYVPAHPGYEVARRPAFMNSVDDLAYLYLDFIEALELEDVVLVGTSVGAWIAAEIATKASPRIASAAFISPVGIRAPKGAGSAIFDIFGVHWGDFEALAFLDQSKIPALDSDEAYSRMALACEATALFTWSPYMHNPKLLSRLHRIQQPTLCVWGAGDRIVGRDYVERFAESLPKSRFVSVELAGHFPHIEQPGQVAKIVSEIMLAPKKPHRSAAQEPEEINMPFTD
jgi:pimeloyl-ACP methyl ester carboxylesterase